MGPATLAGPFGARRQHEDDRRDNANRDQEACRGHIDFRANCGCSAEPRLHPLVARFRAAFIDLTGWMWNVSPRKALLRRRLVSRKGEAMRKSRAVLAAVAALAGSIMAASAPAHAQRYYDGPGYYYGPGYYHPPQSYYLNGVPAPVADPAGPCYWQRQRFWNGFAWRFRSVRVCG